MFVCLTPYIFVPIYSEIRELGDRGIGGIGGLGDWGIGDGG